MTCVFEWDTASAKHVMFQDRPIVRYVACSYVCIASETAFNKSVTALMKGKYFNCCIINTYLLTPWSRVLLEKLTGSQLVKKFLAFYGAQRFITAFTIARHLSLS